MSETMDPLINLYGDSLIIVPTIEWTRYLASSPHTAARYMYVVDHDFAFNDQGPVPGAHHDDEMFMLFDNELEVPDVFVLLNKTSITGEEEPLSAKFVQMWTTFVKTGNPSAPIQEDLGGEWPEFTLEEEAYLSISRSPRVVTKIGPYKDRVALWSTHLPQLSELTANLPAQEPAQEESTSKDEL